MSATTAYAGLNAAQRSASSESVAQQLIDALASMADTMSAGLSGHAADPVGIASGTPQSWADLRLARTVDSYFAF